jgi:hypothetical protein
MKTKITSALWLGTWALAVANPGDLDKRFSPELRAWVAPNNVTMSPNGQAWIGGGFDRADGQTTGDLVRLGLDGGLESEPAPGYLANRSDSPFLLANGDFLLPNKSGNWLRMSSKGVELGLAFAELKPGETISPLFEREGKIWVIRSSAKLSPVLERRESANGSVDPGFQWENYAQPPSDPPMADYSTPSLRNAVPGPNGTVWVLVRQYSWNTDPSDGVVQLDGTGKSMGPMITVAGGAPKLIDPIPLDNVECEILEPLAGDANNPLRQIPLDNVECEILEPGKIADLIADLEGEFGTAAILYGRRGSQIIAGPAGAFRVECGTSGANTYQLQWFSAAGGLNRKQNFILPLDEKFHWAEGADGSFVATGAPPHSAARSNALQRYDANGNLDVSFQSPGSVRSVKALPNGKWLVDGLRRLNADGSEDPTWKVPELETPAEVTKLTALPNERVLALGNFATTNGSVTNRLVVFRANGSVDPAFIPDDRIGEVRSVTVSGQSIYVAATEPVSYGAGVQSNLLKLRKNGTLDENFRSELNARAVHPLNDGDILVTTFSESENVAYENVYRLNPDGSRETDFQIVRSNRDVGSLVTRGNGGFVKGSICYKANGKIDRDLTKDDTNLQPLCEYLDGVLFVETSTRPYSRLRFWRNSGWMGSFQPLALEKNKKATATQGEPGMVYLTGTLKGGVPSLHRLLPSGLVDSSFRNANFASRARQTAGSWWKMNDLGNFDFRPSRHERRTAPTTILWNQNSKLLWAGGDFNTVDGRPRDGIARIIGGFMKIIIR